MIGRGQDLKCMKGLAGLREGIHEEMVVLINGRMKEERYVTGVGMGGMGGQKDDVISRQ